MFSTSQSPIACLFGKLLNLHFDPWLFILLPYLSSCLLGISYWSLYFCIKFNKNCTQFLPTNSSLHSLVQVWIHFNWVSLLFSWKNFVTSYLHICAIQSLLPGMPPFFIYSLKISSLQGPTSSTATFWGLFDHHCRTWPLPLLSCRICLYKPGETHCLIPYL